MKTPNRTSAAAIAPSGMATDSIDLRQASRRASAAAAARVAACGDRSVAGESAPMLTPIPTCGAPRPSVPVSVRLPDDAVDQVVHLLERDVGLLLLCPGRNDDLAGVVLERPLVDDHRTGHELGLGGVGFLLCGGRDRLAVRRDLDEPLLETAAQEMRPGLAALNPVHVVGVDLPPVPL